MVSLLSGVFRFLTILVWFFLSALGTQTRHPQIWVPTYLAVVFLYSTEWFSFFQDPGKKILIAGLGKAIGAGYFIWSLYAFLDNPEPNINSESFRESLGLSVSALWLFLLPFFQRKI